MALEEAEAKGYAKAKNDHVIKCANLIRSEYARGRAELMKEMYGEKCKDYDEDCIVCSQYEVYEELQAQEK